MNFYNLDFDIYGNRITLYLQNGFFILEGGNNNSHVHIYSECHLVIEGGYTYTVNGAQYALRKGEAVIVSPGVFHSYRADEAGAQRVVFQMKGLPETRDACKIQKVHYMYPQRLKSEILSYNASRRGEQLSELLRLLCMELISVKEPLQLKKYDDRSFQIFELINQDYCSDITLGDVARQLHISEKQAGRVVMQCMGMNFSAYLTRCRVAAAEYFLQKSDLSITEIAQRVGFASYNGFWKAFYKKNGVSPSGYREDGRK